SGGGGSGGGGGGWGGWGPGAGQPQGALKLTLKGKRKQRPLRKRRRIVVQATCSATCRLKSVLRVRNARGLRQLRARAVTVAAGTRKRITFKLSRRRTAALRRALRRRKRLKATVMVTATAGAVKVRAKRRIVIRR
ncbi:MAG: hypothetical protein ACRDL4_13095, partial [Thermoleophilaceae bacterium]